MIQLRHKNNGDINTEYQLFISPLLCEYMKDYRTFKEDFFKIIDFCHYLHEEGYDLMKL